MIILLFVLIVAGGLWILIDRNDEERAMKEYCDLECKQDIKSKYHFCC